LQLIENGAIDPSFVVTHTLSLDEAPRGYEMFNHKEDGCIKVVLKPGANGRNSGHEVIH
jgi:threonine dehydrogenase-like Zn-dependent dehydrogenase